MSFYNRGRDGGDFVVACCYEARTNPLAHRRLSGRRDCRDVRCCSAAAQDYVQNPESGMHFYFRYLRTLAAMRTTPGSPSPEVRAEVEIQVNESLEDQVIAGSPETVLDRLIAFRDETGHFGTLLATGHDWDEAGLAMGDLPGMLADAPAGLGIRCAHTGTDS